MPAKKLPKSPKQVPDIFDILYDLPGGRAYLNLVWFEKILRILEETKVKYPAKNETKTTQLHSL